MIMKKRIITLLLAAALAVPFMTGCDDLESDTSESAASSAGSDTQKTDNSSKTDGGSKTDSSSKSAEGITMSVNSADGKMNITRAEKKNQPMGEKDTWTVFVYLCGTDLESSGQGSATSDINQMLEASIDENIKFVIQTGGTYQWMNEAFSEKESQRFVVTKGDIELVDTIPLANMGNPDTLGDFLSWGVSKYPAEKIGVIFWNHGGGSLSGVCCDELNENDALTLPEINSALSSVYQNMTDQFEFIGFDACLMGTIETANLVSTYARYMYGSEETESGSGWDYTSIGNFLGKNPGKNGAELGKVIADSYYEECSKINEENSSTLTIVDLQKIDDLIMEFNSFSRELYDASFDDSVLNEIVKDIKSADNFGGNNKAEGYSNMVDVGGILKSCSGIANADKAMEALENCVAYKKNGSDHKNASGLSIYFPLQLQGGSEELNSFSAVSVNPYYMSIVDKIANGYSADEYNNSAFFSNNGQWVNKDCQCEDLNSEYFGYADKEDDDNSKLITFSQEPVADENGYHFTIDENGLLYTSEVTAFLYLDMDDSLLAMGESYDINADWETGEFSDGFDGNWLSLPNGQLLSTYVVATDSDSVIYTSPVYVNGKRTNLRIRQSGENTIVEGTWDGISDNNYAARGVTKLKKGDKIQAVYSLDDDSEIKADAYEWQDGDSISYGFLPGSSDYYYAFCIEDTYGDYYISDPVLFSIDDKGEITYSEIPA